uniref:Uncharacterized protein n=1 Tax=Rhizophora mucronata TaxID=61149 RepID=A0A2P2P9R1_RHIMU
MLTKENSADSASQCGAAGK